MRFAFAPAFAYAAALLCLIGPAAAQTIQPVYTVSGTSLNGGTYEGTLEARRVGAASYSLRWRIGGETIDGTGMISGDIFAAGYRLNNTFGLVIYRIAEDGSMDGEWTLQAANQVGTERLVPRKK